MGHIRKETKTVVGQKETDSRTKRVIELIEELRNEPQLKDRDSEFVDSMEDKLSNSDKFNLAPWEVTKLEEIYRKLK